MTFLAHLFGENHQAPEDEATAMLQDLIHKVEQTFPESVKVAMRLIEKRAPAVDAVADYGGPAHETFVGLVLKAVYLKHLAADPAARPLTAGDLPAITCLTDAEVPDLGGLLECARREQSELIMMKFTGETRAESNVLLAIEAQLLFASEPATVLVLLNSEDFLARCDWLLEAAAALEGGIKIDQVPAALAAAAQRQDWITEAPPSLTDFGYPLTRFARIDRD